MPERNTILCCFSDEGDEARSARVLMKSDTKNSVAAIGITFPDPEGCTRGVPTTTFHDMQATRCLLWKHPAGTHHPLYPEAIHETQPEWAALMRDDRLNNTIRACMTVMQSLAIPEITDFFLLHSADISLLTAPEDEAVPIPGCLILPERPVSGHDRMRAIESLRARIPGPEGVLAGLDPVRCQQALKHAVSVQSRGNDF